MTVRLNGSTSGYTELDAPAVAGSNTLVLPTGNGTADQALVTNGSGALSFADRGRMTLATAQNTTSGTSIDFTGIPNWVKRVTVMFNGVSTNGSSLVLVQLGAGSVATTGYNSFATRYTGSNGSSYSSSAGIATGYASPADTIFGVAQIANVSGNTWVSSFALTSTGGSVSMQGGGNAGLSGTLDRLRLTTVNGTDTFDAGSVNILYEG